MKRFNLIDSVKSLMSNRWSWPSLFAFNIFSVRPANSGLFFIYELIRPCIWPFMVSILLRPYFAFSGLAYRPFKIGF
jgi:hypothetical protein